MLNYFRIILNKITFKFKRIFFEKIIFRLKNKKKVFEKIYKYNYWGSNESLSGPGSDKIKAKNLISHLPLIIKKYQIFKVFDAPCGDLNWIEEILNKNIIQEYVGADIVKDLIMKNKLKKFTSKCKFLNFDIINDNFPDADLWICRDILYHFSYEDIFKTLHNFCKSDTKYILVSNNLVDDKHINKNIKTGDYRSLSLYHEPFNFKKNPIEVISDVKFDVFKEEMCLWSREQIKDFLGESR